MPFVPAPPLTVTGAGRLRTLPGDHALTVTSGGRKRIVLVTVAKNGDGRTVAVVRL